MNFGLLICLDKNVKKAEELEKSINCLSAINVPIKKVYRPKSSGFNALAINIAEQNANMLLNKLPTIV